VVIVTLLATAIAYSANVQKQSTALGTTAPISKSQLLRGDEPLPDLKYYPTTPGLVSGSPGDTVGYTQYDYQTNGSSGNRIGLDSQGGLHFAWMWADTYPSPRKIYYRYKNPGGGFTSASFVDPTAYRINEGYTQLAVSPYDPGDNGDRAGVAYHNAALGDSLFFGYDAYRGLGLFSINQTTIWFPELIPAHCLWPYMSIDRNNRVHMIASEASDLLGDVQTVGYRRSTDWGVTWTAAAQVDTVITISPIVTSSPVSDKVAIVYTHPFDTTDQWHNDVYWVQSTNGTTWDFRFGKHNVTNYGADTDSITAYTDVDAVYDYNDNLHIIWPAQYLNDSGGSIYYRTRLFHHDATAGTTNIIAESFAEWDTGGCDFGGWNWSIAKSGIGVDIVNNALFATYTSWNLGDCSYNGYANGEIFMNYSTDGGANWTLKGNLTNSPTPDCLPGTCDSDHWSSLAEHADANVHIFYTNDKDAGGTPQTEGEITDSPVLYLAYPNPVRGAAAPGTPTLIFPYNDSTYAVPYYQFQWDDPVGVYHYEFQVDDDPAFGSPVINETNVTNSEYVNINGFLPGVYYWRVKSVGPYGSSAFSATWHFTVAYVGIVGHVYQEDGTTVLPGVNVYALDIAPDTVGAEITGVAGDYTFALVPGIYDVFFTKAGFVDTSFQNIEVTSSLIVLNVNMRAGGGNCDYMPGDINNNGAANGIDVVFGVNYFKGSGTPPINCGSPVGPCPQASPFYAAGDVNGNCAFNGIDITFFVNYLKGIVPALLNCPTCPPAP
jgi:hypothetical protein